MPEPPESPLLLTKVRAPSTASRGAPSRIPPVLLQKVPSRLQALGVWYVAAMGIVWIGVNVAEGHFIQEFDRLGQWLPPTLGMLTALIMLAITWSPSVRLESKLRAGLVFQVVLSYSIAFGVHWGAFRGLTAQDIDGDRIGLSPVAMWMLAFAVLVPARPRSALVALVGSATAIPVVYALSVREGLAPSLAPIAFFTIFCLPYIITAIIAYVMAHIVFNLGQDVRRARELGSYRLRDPLGQGGMGQVWRADHSMLARPAAIKLIKPEALEGDPTQVEAAIARFEREAQITASLESPHSVKLYDFGHTDDGTLYYVMELLEGIDLQSMVERFGAIPAERAVSLLAQACHSFAEAHRRGLIHRDIKPANLFVCRWAFEHDFLKVLPGRGDGVVNRDDPQPRGVRDRCGAAEGGCGTEQRIGATVGVEEHLAVVFPAPRPQVQRRDAPQNDLVHTRPEPCDDRLALRLLGFLVGLPGLSPALHVIR